MKKIISLVLCVMMMLTAAAVSTSAAGNILFTDDFTNGFSPNNWILEGNLFFLDDSSSNPCIAAYSDGVICQAEYRSDVVGTPRWYTNCDYSIRIQVRDFDRDGDHSVGLWWRDDFGHAVNGNELEWELGEVYNLNIDLDNMIMYIESSEVEEPLVTAPVEGVEVGGDWFQLGWKVTPGRMVGYLNGQKVLEYTSEELSAARPSPFLLINNGNFAAYDDIVIADLEYNLFGDNNATPPADDQGEATTTTAATTTSETTTKIVEEVVTNEKGETSVVTKVVTEATTTPKAETNNKPAGGTSTSTGDATFVVIAAMVATLGCAVIVKKVSER